MLISLLDTTSIARSCGKWTDPAAFFRWLRAPDTSRSVGAVMFELLMRTGLWHADADSNLSHADDFERLAQWTVDDARESVGRITDRWAQARCSFEVAANSAIRAVARKFVARECTLLRK
jgi:hypothetical protein